MTEDVVECPWFISQIVLCQSAIFGSSNRWQIHVSLDNPFGDITNPATVVSPFSALVSSILRPKQKTWAKVRIADEQQHRAPVKSRRTNDRLK
ncbi:hypothetical protein ABVT39_002441, partial [Epinephelus coioides]